MDNDIVANGSAEIWCAKGACLRRCPLLRNKFLGFLGRAGSGTPDFHFSAFWGGRSQLEQDIDQLQLAHQHLLKGSAGQAGLGLLACYET